MSDKTNVIKISREFKDNILGGIWLGREISIDDAADPIQAFVKANEELVLAYQRLGGYVGNSHVFYENATPYPVTGTPVEITIPTIQVSKTDSKDKAIQGIKEEIESCKDVTTLGTYQKVALSDDTLKEAYFKTADKLSQLK